MHPRHDVDVASGHVQQILLHSLEGIFSLISASLKRKKWEALVLNLVEFFKRLKVKNV